MNQIHVFDRTDLYSRNHRNFAKLFLLAALALLPFEYAQAESPTLAAVEASKAVESLYRSGQILRDNATLIAPGEKKTKPLLDQPHQISPASGGGTMLLRGLKFVGNDHIDSAELQREIPLIRSSIGANVNQAGLDNLAEAITAYYRAQGYLAAVAYVLAQEVKEGQVTVTIFEGKLDKTLISGHSGYATDELRRTLDQALCGRSSGGCAGAVLHRTEVERAIGNIADLPGIADVSPVLRSGNRQGISDLNVTVNRGPSFNGQIATDNYGNYYTGRNRLIGDLRLNNLAGLGDRVSFNLNTTLAGLSTANADYSQPVGYDGWRLGAGLGLSQYRLGEDYKDLNVHGVGVSLSPYVSYPLIRSSANNLFFRSSLAAKQSRDKNDSIGSDQKSNEVAASGGVDGSLIDGWLGGGVSAWGATLTGGKLTQKGTDGYVTDLNLPVNFGKLNYNLLREQNLASLGQTTRVSLYGAWRGQYAKRHLPAAEGYSLGGPDGVRGYPSGEGGGDKGYITTIELRIATTLSSGWPLLAGSDAGIALFRDQGHVQLFDSKTYSQKSGSFNGVLDKVSPGASQSLGGDGIAFSLGRTDVYNLRAAWAIRDRSGSAPASDGTRWGQRRQKFWLQATVPF